MPGVSARPIRLAEPNDASSSTCAAADISAPVEIVRRPAAGARRNPLAVIPKATPGGRARGPGQLSFGGGRLKNHTGNSLRRLYGRVMIAEQDGTGARQSARRS